MFVLVSWMQGLLLGGGERIDLVGSYAPWAIERCTNICAVDGVCCCLVPTDEVVAVAAMMPVSETHALSMCTNFVAAVPMERGSRCGWALPARLLQ